MSFAKDGEAYLGIIVCFSFQELLHLFADCFNLPLLFFTELAGGSHHFLLHRLLFLQHLLVFRQKVILLFYEALGLLLEGLGSMKKIEVSGQGRARVRVHTHTYHIHTNRDAYHKLTEGGVKKPRVAAEICTKCVYKFAFTHTCGYMHVKRVTFSFLANSLARF